MDIQETLFKLVRNCLFALPAETSHEYGLKGLKYLDRMGLIGWLSTKVVNHPVNCMGLTFPNPVGLAAGLDKNGDYIDALGTLGFGFVEVGTVTPKPQSGNAKPRLFRLKKEQAIINRMGFNNHGVDHLVARVQQSRFKANGGIVGVNIGKNLSTPVENAVDDYLFCMDRVYPWSDYLVINISSPNTPGLRSLQFGDALRALLESLKERQQVLAARYQRRVPLAVKLAPDMSAEEAQQIAEQILVAEIEGVIATNTTASRVGLETSPYANEAGGLSGAPLKELANQSLMQLSEALKGRVALIGVGGIMDGSDAAAKWGAGAQLVQLYTGFIYRGSSLIKDCLDCFSFKEY